MLALCKRIIIACSGLAALCALVGIYGATPKGTPYACQAALFLFTGWWALSRSWQSQLNRFFCAFCLSISAYMALVFLLHLAAVVGLERLVGWICALRLGFFLVIPTLISFVYYFTGGEGRVQRWLAWLSWVYILPFVYANLAGIYVTEYALDTVEGQTYLPAGDPAWYRAFAVSSIIWMLLAVVIVGVCYFRPGHGKRRKQYLLFMLGWGLSLACAISGFLPAFSQRHFFSLAGFSWFFFPTCLAVAVLKYGLFDFKLVIRRTLPYAAGTACIGVIYACVFILLDWILPADILHTHELGWVAFLLIAGLCFQPVLEFLKAWLDTRFFRADAELDQVLESAGLKFAACRTIPELMSAAQGVVTAIFKPESAALIAYGQGIRQVCGTLPVGWAADKSVAVDPQALEAIENAKAFSDGAAATEAAERCLTLKFSSKHTSGILVLGEKRSHLAFDRKDFQIIRSLAKQFEGALNRIEAEDNARTASEMVESLLRAFSQPVAVVAEGGKITRSNQAFQEAFGLEDSLGGTPLAAEWAERSWHMPREIAWQGRTYLAMRHQLPNSDEGQCILALSDITELRNLQLQERRHEVLAQIGAAVSGINHEVQNILSPVTFNLDRVERNLGETAKAKEYLDKVRGRLALLKGLTDGLRQYYKTPELALKSVNLREVVEGALGDVGAGAVAFVPPALEGLDIAIMADPQKARQVFLNLLKNAWEAMGERSQKAWTVSAESASGHAVIRIRDNGAGIPANLMPKVFQLFFSTKADRGTGLGMSVCKRIIETHGGSIEIESQEGKGTLITLRWPSKPSGN